MRERLIDGSRIGVNSGHRTNHRRKYGHHVEKCSEKRTFVFSPERQIRQCGENHGERNASHGAH